MNIDVWKGKFGDDYTERNQNTQGRKEMFTRILDALPVLPDSILEVGANRGLNLDVLHNIIKARLIGLEPNDSARQYIKHEALDGTAQQIKLPDKSVAMVFTCGVLIHIPPEELHIVCNEIYRVASRYIVCIEYFSDKPEEVQYRGYDDMLWKRDFGSYWRDNYPLKLLDYGFLWKPVTGLDNLTYFVFEK